MKRICLSLGLIILALSLSIAQQPDRCGSDAAMERMFKQFPELKKKYAKESTVKKINNKLSNSVPAVIPVHVIIVHPPGQAIGTGDNLSIEHIESQITVLNEDFRRTNSDASNTPPEFPAGDSNIEFCLASVDPSGNPTDGVTRHGTNQNFDANEFSIKAATGWDRDDYLNIWVAPSIGTLGYAYVPTTSSLPNSTRDGVAIFTGTFGGPGYATFLPYNLGRTTTHEAGHYLGLEHVWGPCGDSCCGVDDGIADTPNQSGNTFGCPSHPKVSCGTNDMFMNFMDYVDDNCMNAFSVGQGNYMNTILSSSRSSLLGSASVKCITATPLSGILVSQFDPLCFGEFTGIIEVQGNGGVQPYTYSLNGGVPQFTGYFDAVQAGNHIVSIFDDIGQQFDIQVFLFDLPAVEIITLLKEDISCNGEEDGIISVQGSGGSGSSYSYTANGGPSMPSGNFENLPSDTYVVSVYDGNNCLAEETYVIEEPDTLMVEVDSLVNIKCYGDMATVFLEVEGGTPGFTFILDTISQMQSIFDSLPSCEYTVMVVDVNNCMSSVSFEVDAIEEMSLSIVDVDSIFCYRDVGSVSLAAVGGVEPFLYAIDTDDFSENSIFSVVPSGMHEFFVMDMNGCLDTIEIELNEPDEMDLDIDDVQSVQCFGDFSGSINISGMGGTGILTFDLDGNINTTGEYSGLTSGMYTIIVTDEEDCSASIEAEVEQLSTLEVQGSPFPVECNGGNNGSVNIDASGGSGGYEYSFDGGPFSNQTFYDNLPAGMYELIGEDNGGCQDQIFVEITEPDALSISLLNIEHNDCYGDIEGSVSFDATGGFPGSFGYMYGILGVGNNDNGVFDDLEAGDYVMTVIDENFCSADYPFTIDEGAEIDVDLISVSEADCDGNETGAFSIQALGGADPYEYSLGGEINNFGMFANLTAGDHTVMIIDNNDCERFYDITIPTSSDITSTIAVANDVSCFGGNDGLIDINSSGGSGTLTYELGGATNTDGIFDNLTPDNYFVSISDENDCISVVEVTIGEPDKIIIEETCNTSISCHDSTDGRISLAAEGGSGDYTFTIDAMTNSSGVFTGLESGTLTAQVTDSENCTSTMQVVIDSPHPIEIDNANGTATSCHDTTDGGIEANANGGTGALTYTIGASSNSDGQFSGLTSGDHLLIVTDANNCSTSQMVNIGSPAAIAGNVDQTVNVDCFGAMNGSVNVSALGGFGNLSYELDGITNDTGLFTGIDEGNYEVTVEDQNGCTTAISFSIDEPLSIQLTISDQSIDTGEENGSIFVQPNGGSSPYEYSIDGVNFQSSSTFDNLPAGTYVIIVQDAQGCSSSVEAQIELTEIFIDYVIHDIGLFPNPNDGNFQVNFISNGDQNVFLHMYNAIGQYVTRRIYEVQLGSNSITFNSNDMAEGVYVISLEGMTNIEFYKIVVTH